MAGVNLVGDTGAAVGPTPLPAGQPSAHRRKKESGCAPVSGRPAGEPIMQRPSYLKSWVSTRPVLAF